jgi:ATP-dependent protease ClpP protease subunit
MSDDKKNPLFEKQPLLENHALIISPADLTDSTIPDLIWALVEARRMYPDREIHFILSGWGGNADPCLGLHDLILQDGNVWGYIFGSANSGHSVVWSGCNRRFVYPNAIMGIHRSYNYFNSNEMVDTRQAALNQQRLETTDKMIAQIYARASKKEYNWWLQQLNKGQLNMVQIFTADQLVEMEMAEYAKQSPFLLARNDNADPQTETLFVGSPMEVPTRDDGGRAASESTP